MLHGPGAKRKWRPIMKRKRGPDGNYSLRMHKETYYECTPAMMGGGKERKMTQTKLSFGPMERRKKGEDTTQGYLGEKNATAGQSTDM